jgi:hypothetical protein
MCVLSEEFCGNKLKTSKNRFRTPFSSDNDSELHIRVAYAVDKSHQTNQQHTTHDANTANNDFDKLKNKAVRDLSTMILWTVATCVGTNHNCVQNRLYLIRANAIEC